ncbi:MAG: phytanoyl-CoA dioxygenase family protein, partial [Planctomycetota bacterium]|nr:phytanoyl-CoA dioxygenase family protein [Planctomycetota bacterium]
YHKLIYNPQVCEEVAQLTGAEELRVWHDQIQYKPAEKGGVNMWHQDSPLWPSIKPKTSQVSAWIALDDIDESNGCMSMVPGSHLWGNQIQFLWTIKEYTGMPAEFQGHKLQPRLCPVRKGEVHFHHALTWHGSHANLSNRPRRAIAIHYMTQETVLDNSGAHPMKDFAHHLSDGQKMEGEHFPLTWSRATAGAVR